MRWIVALLVVVLAGVGFVAWSRIDDCDGVSVTVFLEPDIPDERRRVVREEIGELEEIESEVVYVDSAEAYEEFSEMFRDQPDMVDDVGPSDLPSSYRFRVDAEALPTVGRRLQGLPGVHKVAHGPCRDDFRLPTPPRQSSSRSSSIVRTGSAPTGTTLSVVTPASR